RTASTPPRRWRTPATAPTEPPGSALADPEAAERHAQVPAVTGARQRQADRPLGDHLGIGRTHRARVRLGRDVTAQHLIDAAHAGEHAGAVVDPRPADAQAPAAGFDLHGHALA